MTAATEDLLTATGSVPAGLRRHGAGRHGAGRHGAGRHGAG